MLKDPFRFSSFLNSKRMAPIFFTEDSLEAFFLCVCLKSSHFAQCVLNCFPLGNCTKDSFPASFSAPPLNFRFMASSDLYVTHRPFHAETSSVELSAPRVNPIPALAGFMDLPNSTVPHRPSQESMTAAMSSVESSVFVVPANITRAPSSSSASP